GGYCTAGRWGVATLGAAGVGVAVSQTTMLMEQLKVITQQIKRIEHKRQPQLIPSAEVQGLV
ncbi:MAG: hypothetical protein M3466_00110, partial [Gemmatimonadota bacterium]|nr:hypothetical protein [Gemmatimonadota bacterium]